MLPFFVLVNKFVCDTHLFSTLIVDHVWITLEGVKRVLFYTIPSEFHEKVVINFTVPTTHKLHCLLVKASKVIVAKFQKNRE